MSARPPSARRPSELTPADPASTEAGAIRDLRLGVDARYLQRNGLGISIYLRAGIGDLLDAGACLTLLTDDHAHAAKLREEFPSAAVTALPDRSGFLWEQITLRRHLSAASYEAYLAPANFGLPLRYRGDTRMILVIHDLIPLRLAHLYTLRKPVWAASYFLSLLIAALRADRIIAVSEATASDITRLLWRRPVAVAYPQVPPAGRAPAKPAGRSRNPLGLEAPGGSDLPRRPYFVYNGGADIRKNVPTLLRAFRLVRAFGPADLVMLGTGYDRFKPLISKLGIAENVIMPGYVGEEAKAAILRGAIALVYPSRLEGFGLPVVEGFAAGVPVISGTGGALPEVGGDAVTYVQPMTAPALAAAMARTTDQQLRDRFRELGRIQLETLRARQQQRTFAGAVAAAASRPAGQVAARR